MVQPEISTVLDSGAAPQHDGMFAFGCIILVLDAGERGSPPALIYDDVHIYMLCCSVAFSLRVSLISHRGCSPRPPVHHQPTWRAHAARRARLCLASAGGGGQLPAPTCCPPADQT